MNSARLSVLWLAHDELSCYGLPALLDHVPEVIGHQVCRDALGVERALSRDRFDVGVFPLDAYGPALDARCRDGIDWLVLTLSDAATLHPGLAHGRAVDAWLLQQRITLRVVRETFRQLAGPGPASAASGGQFARGLGGSGSAAASAPRRINGLTGRELSVLRLLARGLTNQQIARALGISVHGVKRHVSNLMMKFGCTNRTEVALAATRLM